MMKKSLILYIVWLFTALCARAQVENYALSFAGNGSVHCGELVQMEQQTSYTIQFWICPDEWNEGAVIFKSGDKFSACLDTEGSIVFTVGETSLRATAKKQLSIGNWAQVTLLCNEGAAKVYANTVKCASGTLAAIPETASGLVIGEGFKGRLDEMRFWKIALTDEFDYFRHNTINQFNPDWDNLVVYYKMDQELCENLVDYKGVYSHDVDYNYHGTLNGDAQKVKVTDNTGLPYLVNGAYTNNERFYDRSIPREQYLLSNDLIILGVESFKDGHLRFSTPCNHGTFDNCEWLAEFEGRNGVLSLNGDGKMSVGKNALLISEDNNGKATNAYAFECWLYLDEWTEGAYLFRKENEDGTQGLSIRLGEADKQQVIVRVDGRDYGHGGKLVVGEWMHFGIVSRTATSSSQLFGFVYNGTMSLGKNSMSDSVADNKPTNTSKFEAYIGEGLKGKMDDILIWNNRPFDNDEMKSNMEGRFRMPGIGAEVTAEQMRCYNSLWRFDKKDDPGYDTYSQDEWLAIMKSAYNGYRGAKFRISVKSHDGWENTISNKSRREIFAADLAELSKNYDGVELDLEWASSWANYGLLAEAIRKALPEGKIFEVSVHAYNYKYPIARMGAVDAFTVQQYGPQKNWFSLSNFRTTLMSMENYGYAKDKIYASYSTTTSGPYMNGTMVSSVIKGVRSGLMEGDFEPNEEMDSWTGSDGLTYFFTGPLQTYKRAKYVADNLYHGIFYWDMGNDVPVRHQYNLAKWCSYALNANVDTLITHVDVKPYDASLGIREMHLTDSETSMVGEVSVYNMIGLLVRKAATREEAVAMLPRGFYIMRGRTPQGRKVAIKVNKQY